MTQEEKPCHAGASWRRVAPPSSPQDSSAGRGGYAGMPRHAVCNTCPGRTISRLPAMVLLTAANTRKDRCMKHDSHVYCCLQAGT